MEDSDRLLKPPPPQMAVVGMKKQLSTVQSLSDFGGGPDSDADTDGKIEERQRQTTDESNYFCTKKLEESAAGKFTPKNDRSKNKQRFHVDVREEKNAPKSINSSQKASPKQEHLSKDNNENEVIMNPSKLLSAQKEMYSFDSRSRLPSAYLLTKIARVRKRFGFRHIILVSLLGLYAVAGGAIFQAIEGDYELQSLETNRRLLDATLSELSRNITLLFVKSIREQSMNKTQTSNSGVVNQTSSAESKTMLVPEFDERIEAELKLLIQNGYTEMLRTEGRYVGSVFQRFQKFAVSISWSLGNSIFYAVSLITTIGYGTVACQTSFGKAVSILYAILGIPLMLLVLSDIGQLLLKWLTDCYCYTREQWKRMSKVVPEEDHYYHRTNTPSMVEDDKDYEQKSGPQRNNVAAMAVELPVFITSFIVTMYLLSVSLFVYVFDYHADDAPGISFYDALYFCFISLTTIGLGDVMPNNIEYSPILALLFLAGIALFSVFNCTVYTKLQIKFLSVVDRIDAFLDQFFHIYAFHDDEEQREEYVPPERKISVHETELPPCVTPFPLLMDTLAVEDNGEVRFRQQKRSLNLLPTQEEPFDVSRRPIHRRQSYLERNFRPTLGPFIGPNIEQLSQMSAASSRRNSTTTPWRTPILDRRTRYYYHPSTAAGMMRERRRRGVSVSTTTGIASGENLAAENGYLFHDNQHPEYVYTVCGAQCFPSSRIGAINNMGEEDFVADPVHPNHNRYNPELKHNSLSPVARIELRPPAVAINRRQQRLIREAAIGRSSSDSCDRFNRQSPINNMGSINGGGNLATRDQKARENEEEKF